MPHFAGYIDHPGIMTHLQDRKTRYGHTNGPIEVYIHTVADGININQRSRTGDTENEAWHLEVLESGAYVITSNFSNKAAASRNTNVEQEGIGTEANQQWVIEPAAQEGYFHLRNLGDNRYLDVFGRRNSFDTTIITWPFHGRTNQQWSFEPIAD